MTRPRVHRGKQTGPQLPIEQERRGRSGAGWGELKFQPLGAWLAPGGKFPPASSVPRVARTLLAVRIIVGYIGSWRQQELGLKSSTPKARPSPPRANAHATARHKKQLKAFRVWPMGWHCNASGPRRHCRTFLSNRAAARSHPSTTATGAGARSEARNTPLQGTPPRVPSQCHLSPCCQRHPPPCCQCCRPL